ncbi:hypothetical protein [Loigolactobacillus jiayinensis]|uniref:Uncharacterized protein n=1 Tax=Loigolactobacillus jiayinensis TaxID=2486016 RepID=A0ABW1RDQ3_9LACO|nr:hypothetical protein [Loigolactobacillus jiayinensis]
MARQLKVARHYRQSVSFTSELTVVVTLSGYAHFAANRQLHQLVKQGLICWRQTSYLRQQVNVEVSTMLDNPLILLVVPQRWTQDKQIQRVQQVLTQLLQQVTTLKLICSLPLKFTLQQRQQLRCWLAVKVQAVPWLSTYLWSPKLPPVTRTADRRIDHASYQRVWRADIFSSE